MKKILFILIFGLIGFFTGAQTITEGPSWVQFNFDDGTSCRAYNCFDKYCFGDRIQISDYKGAKYRVKPEAFVNPDTGVSFIDVPEMCNYLDSVYERICETGQGSGTVSENGNLSIEHEIPQGAECYRLLYTYTLPDGTIKQFRIIQQ